MNDLLQLVEHGFRDDTGVDWYRGYGLVVTPANRRRILDRDDTVSEADGWCYQDNPLSDEVVAVTRIRWEDVRLYAPADLELRCQTWTS